MSDAMFCPSRSLIRTILLAAALSAAVSAQADAPRDIQGSLRLWLDGLDIYGTDTTGNGGGTNPANGAQVTGWSDKSGNGYTAGDAASYGSYAHTFPTYSSALGVSFDGVSNALEVSGGIYGTGTTVSNSDIFVVASTRSIKLASLLYAGPAVATSSDYRINFHAPYSQIRANDGSYVFHHGTINSALTISWSSSGAKINQNYIYNIGGTSGSTQYIIRDGTTLGTLGSSLSFIQTANSGFYLGSGGTFFNGTHYESYHDGTISELIVYSRRLKAAEKNILLSHLAAKHANPGGAGTASKYTPPGNFRYYVGGIGQESDGSLTTGTSAGLTITNSAFLANGRYLLAGVDSLTPATGGTATDKPAGTFQRAQRVWYIQNTSTGSPGIATLTFNLAQMGVSAPSGQVVSLLYRSGTTGAFSTVVGVTYNGSGTISFQRSNPPTGYYTLSIPTPLSYTIAAGLTSTTAADPVNSSNFKAIPGARVKATATVTNNGNGSPDADATILSLPIPANMKFYLGDIGAAGGGPVQFTQGTTPSGLTYSYTALGSLTDSLDFSNNAGSTWTYVPTPDAQQADAAITNIRVKPSDTFSTGTSPNFPSFNVTYGLVVK